MRAISCQKKYSRYVLRKCIHKDNEALEQYMTEPQLKSQLCNFSTLTDSLIGDQMVIGELGKGVGMPCLEKTDWTLENTMKISILTMIVEQWLQTKSQSNRTKNCQVYTIKEVVQNMLLINSEVIKKTFLTVVQRITLPGPSNKTDKD